MDDAGLVYAGSDVRIGGAARAHEALTKAYRHS